MECFRGAWNEIFLPRDEITAALPTEKASEWKEKTLMITLMTAERKKSSETLGEIAMR